MQNGKATILFVAKSLEIGGSSSHGAAYTIWMVLKSGSVTDNNIYFSSTANGGLYFRSNSSPYYFYMTSLATASIATGNLAFNATTYHTVIITFSGGASGTYAFYLDGTDAGHGSHTVSLSGVGTFSFGSDYAYYGEMGICNAVLSSGDITSLQAELKSVWATP